MFNVLLIFIGSSRFGDFAADQPSFDPFLPLSLAERLFDQDVSDLFWMNLISDEFCSHKVGKNKGPTGGGGDL